MPLLPINAGPDGLCLHLTGARPDAALREMRHMTGPVIVMVHGYKFAPGHVRACPHRHILSLSPRPVRTALSWPRGLGFGTGAAGEGLAIGFGWPARGTLGQAYGRASHAATELAHLIDQLHGHAPHRPVHLIAHSLGARVVLGALAQVRTAGARRIILLNAAEYALAAELALTSPAGRRAEVIHITSRENDLFDFLFERLIRPPARGARCLTEAFPTLPNTLQIQIDHPAAQRQLARAGFDVSGTPSRVCHWSPYLRPGAMALYRALLRTPERLPLSQLRAALPDRPDPRWSRLWPGLRPDAPGAQVQAWLSSAGKTRSTMNQ
ncbi:alpha/beta hydrolase [Roseovarius aestuariivivens]|uniref:alpha/beta hydrolase n=1 Tax=Roseovarius aestuariivivens TaxID=1888910 RepID=UPI0010812A8F|nr:alpha/beta hydrolase [Roseovarius aestuariivivens]